MKNSKSISKKNDNNFSKTVSATPRTSSVTKAQPNVILESKTSVEEMQKKTSLEENLITETQKIIAQQTQVLTKIEEIATKLNSPKKTKEEENLEIEREKLIESNKFLIKVLKAENLKQKEENQKLREENEKDKLIESLKSENQKQKEEIQKLKDEIESLKLMKEHNVHFEDTLDSIRIAFSNSATDLMNNIKMMNPKYVKNQSLMNPKFINDQLITLFFLDINDNLKNNNSKIYDELHLCKREKVRLEDEILSLQRRGSEIDIVRDELAFYKRLYHSSLKGMEVNSSQMDNSSRYSQSNKDSSSKNNDKDNYSKYSFSQDKHKYPHKKHKRLYEDN